MQLGAQVTYAKYRVCDGSVPGPNVQLFILASLPYTQQHPADTALKELPRRSIAELRNINDCPENIKSRTDRRS